MRAGSDCVLLLLTASLAAQTISADDFLTQTGRDSLRHAGISLPPSFSRDSTTTIPEVAPVPTPPPQWPTADWNTSTPAAQGMDPFTLRRAIIYGIGHRSRAMLVTRHGFIVAEWYAEGWDKDTTETGFSIAKSFTSALVGILLEDGSIERLDERAADYIPSWRDDAHSWVTIRHLLSMTSGLYWDPVTDYALLASSPDQNAFSIGLPMAEAPGSMWVYNNSACQVLSAVILAATGRQPHEIARERLWNRIGMHNATWMTDQQGNTLTYQSVIASAREFAKFGYLFLRNGEWNGARVIPEAWVRSATRNSQSLNPFYGYLWWLNTGGLAWPSAPADSFAALGAGNKAIYVVPSLDIVAVRLGPASARWSDDVFLGLICAAAAEPVPILPASPLTVRHIPMNPQPENSRLRAGVSMHMPLEGLLE
jgi:CubicO group peptidase (beta-lactamase class C family)